MRFLTRKSNTRKSNTRKSNTRKSNTRKSNTRKSNTRKSNTRNVKGKQFVKKLLKEFKNKNFYIKHDKIKGDGHCLNDYYLSPNNIDSYDEHIHLILHNYKKDEDNNDDFGYMFKKYNKSHTEYIHSEYVKITIDDDCKKLNTNMIKEYNKFLLE
jgi:hypothetical protein